MAWARWLTLLIVNQGAAPVPQAELVWIQAPEAQSCKEEALRQSVALRLGYDPFVASHPTKVLVELGGAQTLTARVRVARHGKPSAERLLQGPADCQNLTDALALALAVAVDPLVLTRAPTPPAPTPAPPAPPPPAPTAAVVQTSLPAPKAQATPIETHLSVTIAPAVEVGHQPGGLWAGRLGTRFQVAFLSLGLAGWALLPTSEPLEGGGTVEAWSAGGLLEGCFHVWRLAACAAGKTGGLSYQGKDLLDARGGWVLTTQVGPRLWFEWPGPSSPVAVHAAGEMWFAALRTHMQVSGSAEWEQPQWAAGALLGLTLRAW